MDLKDFSNEELKRELSAREEKEFKISVPKQLDNPDFSGIIKSAQSVIDEIVAGEYHEDNDDSHYMYEDVMEAVFGKGVWKFINDNM